MSETEGEPGDEDRGPRPDELRQEAVAEPAKEQLLDERRREHHDRGVREERGRARRVPGVGHEALLVARVEERAQGGRRGDDTRRAR